MGNHTYSHQRMVFKGGRFIDDELDKTNALIRDAGYTGEIMFRPPFGKKLALLPLALKERGMTTVMWSMEPESEPDAAEAAGRIAGYVMENVRAGDIIPLHIMYDGGAASREAIPVFVKQLQEKGYSFVAVSELPE